MKLPTKEELKQMLAEERARCKQPLPSSAWVQVNENTSQKVTFGRNNSIKIQMQTRINRGGGTGESDSKDPQ